VGADCSGLVFVKYLGLFIVYDLSEQEATCASVPGL
jgi:hypothetical protein